MLEDQIVKLDLEEGDVVVITAGETTRNTRTLEQHGQMLLAAFTNIKVDRLSLILNWDKDSKVEIIRDGKPVEMKPLTVGAKSNIVKCEKCGEPLKRLKGSILHHQVECPKCGHPKSFDGLGKMVLEYETIPDTEEVPSK